MMLQAVGLAEVDVLRHCHVDVASTRSRHTARCLVPSCSQLPVQIHHGNESTTSWRCRRMLFAIEHRNTDVDNTITRETLLTTVETDSLWHVVLT